MLLLYLPLWLKISLGVIVYLLMTVITSVIIIKSKDMDFDTNDDSDIFIIGFLSFVWIGVLPMMIVINVINKIGNIGKRIAQRLDKKQRRTK